MRPSSTSITHKEKQMSDQPNFQMPEFPSTDEIREKLGFDKIPDEVKEDLEALKKASTPRTVTKFIVANVAAFCASGAVSMALKNNTFPVNRRQKAMLVIGVYAIGSVVGDRVYDYYEGQVDKLFDAIDEIKSESN